MAGQPLPISDPRLQRLYGYWSTKKGQRKMPSRADIDVLDLRYVLGNIMLVDVIEGSPPRFRIRLHGSNLSARAGYELTGKMLDELPESEFRKQVRERWTEVATTGEPRRCDRNLRVFDSRSYHYESIVLPLSADGETVNMELVALIYRDA
jgi:hypothetical protein